MQVYQQIDLLPGSEIGLGFLWEKVYHQIHLAMVQQQDADGLVSVGVGFPEYCLPDESLPETFPRQHPLGKTLRVYGPDSDALQALNLAQQLLRLGDYVYLTRIRELPERAQQAVVYQRCQVKTNPERLARRKAKRDGIPFSDAIRHYSKFRDRALELPFVPLKSQSSDQHFRLFISRSLLVESKAGRFTTYGLSVDGATVPEIK